MSASTHDVVIRHATVHVVRRGGWSWGHDAQALVDSVKRALPALLSRAVERAAATADADVEITERLTISVPLRLADLHRLAASSESAGTGEAMETIANAIARTGGTEIVARAFASAATAEDQCLEQGVSNDTRLTGESGAKKSPETSARALLNMLCQWEQRAELAHRCATLPPTLLRQWLDHLRREWPTPQHIARAPSDERVEQVREQAQRAIVLLPAGEHADLVRSVILAVYLYTLQGLPRAHARRVLERAGPQQVAADSVGELADAQVPFEAISARSPRQTGLTAADDTAPATAAAHHSSTDFEIDIPSALPFLLLGPLSRIGYLEALRVACNVAGGTHLSTGFAAALACKALSVPQRGWYREAPQRLAVAAFAGRTRVLEDQEVAASAYALRAQASLFDQLIAANLVQGHRAEAAWLLCAAERDVYILFDADGLFPVAVESPRQLAALIAPSGAPLYVARSAAATPVFETLDALQIPYLAREREGSSSVSVSSHGAHQGRMRAFAKCGEQLCDRARAAWQAIRMERSILRQPADSSIEVSLSLAASLALGTIAWTLWRSREATDPLLALERFSDLDARVRSTAKSIQVRLPLGRRFWDLRDHGLLAEVRDVPWLDGRTVVFGAG